MTLHLTLVMVAATLTAAALPAAAMQATGTAGSAAPVAPAASQQAAPPSAAIEPQGYDYDPRGRRDPFVSLIRRGAEAPGSAPATRPAGLPGLLTSEVSLRGTITSRDGFVAMLQGADSKTYLARVGDRLLDGTIHEIEAGAVIIRQKVNDPLSLDTERDVRKVLRQPEEAK